MRTTLILLVLLAVFPTKPSGALGVADEGKATYYTEESCQREGTSGTWTASGKRFDESKLTCAMRRRDWGSKWRVTSLETGKSVVVTLTDFGPGKKPASRGVIVDLTPAAWRELGARKGQGTMRVRVERVE